jgi:sigma-B regulation protein RsbU (phosphoserine phosphatase)
MPEIRSGWPVPASLAVACAWLFGLTLWQVAAGGRLVVVPALALAALAESLLTGWRPTAFVAVLSVGAVALLSSEANDATTINGIARIAGAAALGGFAIANSELRLRRERRIRRVAEVAAIAQATIMRPVRAQIGPLELASRYESATAEALIGGDFFDVLDTPTGVRIIIGDVRGKGLPAVKTAATTLAGFRQNASRLEMSLPQIATAIEHQLTAGLGDEDFVTALLCELESNGRFTVVNCGHHPPLLLSPQRPAALLTAEKTSPPLGLGVTPTIAEFRVDPGDRLLLYTDGLVEARDRSGAFLDFINAAAMTLRCSVPVDRALGDLVALVHQYVGGDLSDDLCLLLIHWQRSGVAFRTADLTQSRPVPA